MKTVKKEMNLDQFLVLAPVLKKFYSGIMEFDKALEITKEIIKPLNEIQENHDNVLQAYRQESKDATDERKIKIEAEYREMLITQKVELTIAKISSEDAKRSGITNPNELALVFDYIEESTEKAKK